MDNSTRHVTCKSRMTCVKDSGDCWLVTTRGRYRLGEWAWRAALCNNHRPNTAQFPPNVQWQGGPLLVTVSSGSGAGVIATCWTIFGSGGATLRPSLVAGRRQRFPRAAETELVVLRGCLSSIPSIYSSPMTNVCELLQLPIRLSMTILIRPPKQTTVNVREYYRPNTSSTSSDSMGQDTNNFVRNENCVSNNLQL